MLLDWIIDVVQEFTLESETLFITVSFIRLHIFFGRVNGAQNWSIIPTG